MQLAKILLAGAALLLASCSSPAANEIQVREPQPGAAISSPITISGRARGSWFFEGSFPLELQDSTSRVLASGTAQASSDWMTEDFVDFSAELRFESPQGGSGQLILRRDNPSGLPEHDASQSIPVRFGS